MAQKCAELNQSLISKLEGLDSRLQRQMQELVQLSSNDNYKKVRMVEMRLE